MFVYGEYLTKCKVNVSIILYSVISVIDLNVITFKAMGLYVR